MDTPISSAKRLIKMLERLIKKDYLYTDELKFMREQLLIAPIK